MGQVEIFSGLHNTEANPEARNFFWHMYQPSNSYWDWEPFSVGYPVIIHPWWTDMDKSVQSQQIGGTSMSTQSLCIHPLMTKFASRRS